MTPDALVALAQFWLGARRLRNAHFPSSLFDEQAWDMMLHLFIDHAEGRRPDLPTLVAAIGGTEEVGRRWLSYLVQEQRAEQDERGGIALTQSARQALSACLTEVVPGLMAIGERLRSDEG